VSTGIENEPTPVRVTRAREGRWLAGVCAGLPGFWRLGTNGLRLLFVVAALCGGIGIVIYLACWLVIPQTDHDVDDDAVRSVVLLAWATGGLVALVLLAAGGAVATAFGLGWIVFVVAALLVAVMLSGRTRIPSLAALLVVASITLPAVAVALSPVRIPLRAGPAVRRPTDVAQIQDTVVKSGFGMTLIDLRHTKLPTSGTVTMRIDAGLRRTIVALPADECVHVQVSYKVHTFVSQLATLLSGHSTPSFHDLVLFGRVFGPTDSVNPYMVVSSRGDRPGPLLKIDFSSLGGGLYVRDYPESWTESNPSWPGFPVTLEPPPSRSYLRGLSAKHRAQTLSAWRTRRRADLASQQSINKLMPGPCAS
jgi:phage shock protein PspC (stress-responsive transcriptional regulator)